MFFFCRKRNAKIHWDRREFVCNCGSFGYFIIALEMILGIEIHKVENVKAASIVPIAFPLVAGAGTLTTTLSLRAEFHVVNIILGILLNTILVYIVLKSANFLEEKIGDATLMIFKKFWNYPFSDFY